MSSHMNTWTESNVRLRNQDNPSMSEDYSILERGDAIKDSGLVMSDDNNNGTFEYRLEASGRGRSSSE